MILVWKNTLMHSNRKSWDPSALGARVLVAPATGRVPECKEKRMWEGAESRVKAPTQSRGPAAGQAVRTQSRGPTKSLAVTEGCRLVDSEPRGHRGLSLGGCWKLDCSACPQLFGKSTDFLNISLVNGSQWRAWVSRLGQGGADLRCGSSCQTQVSPWGLIF